MVGTPSSLEAFNDAQGQNNIDRNVRQWRDLDLFFQRKPSTSDVNKVTDVQAVKRSVRNLVLLNHFEKRFHPEIGSGVRDMLFEPMTPITAVILAKHVEDVVENFEPRARLIGVQARPDLDRNVYDMTIEFYVVNVPTELVTLDVMLERIR